MIRAYLNASKAVILDDNLEHMRFADVNALEAFIEKEGKSMNDVFWEDEDDDESLYRDIVESFMLALKPHIGKTLTDDIVYEVKQTVHDAVGNNVFS